MAELDPTAAIALLYRRAGFGAGPDEVAAGVARGYAATVDALVAGLSAPDVTGDAVPPPTFAPRNPDAGPSDRAAATAQRAVYRQETPAAQDCWMDRMIVTDTPLREKMTLLWSGHFATGISKVADPQLMWNQNQLLRDAGAGPFAALTQAVAQDPAMMIWLDTYEDNAKHPNENFARELMELFTLGLGNFTQADVTAAAAAFTGYSLERSSRTYIYRPRLHASAPVTFLGHTGSLTGEDVIDILVHEPASARFIVASTWSHLAYPVAPDDGVVNDLLASYSPDQPFATLLRAVFLHPLFTSATTLAGLVKQPLEYVAGAARALGLDAGLGGRRHGLVAIASALGQTMYDPPSVGGWPQNGYWCNTATSLARWQAGQLMAQTADLSALEAVPASGRLAAVGELLGISGWSAPSTAALGAVVAEPTQLVALALNAPEYVLA
jgi:uncharacterized protein (DUF1800 family)